MATDEEQQTYRAALAKLDASKRRLNVFGQTIHRMAQLFEAAENLHIESASEGRAFASGADTRLPRVLQSQWPTTKQLTDAIEAFQEAWSAVGGDWRLLGGDTSELRDPTRSVKYTAQPNPYP